MTRKEHWELELHNFVDTRAGEPFAWGANDCALFVCDGIQAMTGTDVAGEFRGLYDDEVGALRRMKEVTGRPDIEAVVEHVTAAQQMRELSTVRLAQRGDVVLFDGSLGPAIGLVYLNGTHAVFVGPDGLRRVALADCRRAWRL